MLELHIAGVRVRIGLLFFSVLTALLIWDGSGVAAWCFAASVMHEGGHLAALFLVSVYPKELCFGAFGMRLILPEGVALSYQKQLAVALAGPAVNAVCAAALYLCGGNPAVIAVHAIIGGFNLLPVVPLDGGQALRCLLLLVFKEKTAEILSLIISLLVLIPLAAIGFFLLLQSGYNFTLLMVTGYLALLLIFKRRD